jgi:excisionase family DNA binding protein
MLLTTKEVAALLKVHPKHVYRLLKRGLPAHRVGDEWRFDEDEVRGHVRSRGRAATADPAAEATATRAREGALGESTVAGSGSAGARPAAGRWGPGGPRPMSAPPLLAANGDVALEVLLDEARGQGAPLVGHVQADHATGLALLESGAVLLSGSHGDGVPADVAGLGYARIHITDREVGLAFRRGLRLLRVTSVVGRRLASRPATAGVRAHLDRALLAAGAPLERAYRNAESYRSHRDVVMAVARGDAEVGLTSRAWAVRAGLAFLPLASESYGLLLRAADLGDPRVTGLCEIAQTAAYKRRLRGDLGYEPRKAGEIRLGTFATARPG